MSLLSSLAERVLRDRLAALRGGTVVLRDAGTESRFGPDAGTAVVVEVRDRRFYPAVILGGAVGAGEALGQAGDPRFADILAPLRTNKYDLVMPGAQAVQTLDLRKKGLKIELLLTSSGRSWGKRDIANAKTVAKETGDLAGPFALAVAITHTHHNSAAFAAAVRRVPGGRR